MVLSRIIAMAALLALGEQVLACDYPGSDDIVVPDGATASEQQMLKAQQTVTAYIKAMEDFLECLGREFDALEEPTPEAAQLRDLRHNAAVGAMEDIAERFNIQVRKYNARLEE